MEHKWLRLYKNDVWTGREDRMVTLADGSEHCIDDLAKQHGLDLPDSGAKPKQKAKKQINTDIEEQSHEDMEGALHGGDTQEHDGGDSEG
tara:strand:+ start:2541 stop:2810 length:270 start_codon:yes stop_codon:yes gene_type:complete